MRFSCLAVSSEVLILSPGLPAKYVVQMDNLSSHQVQEATFTGNIETQMDSCIFQTRQYERESRPIL